MTSPSGRPGRPTRSRPRRPAPPPADPARAAYDARPWLAAYPSGLPADLALPDVPVDQLLTDAARAFPHRAAIAFLGTTTSYRELADQVDRCAAGLARLGVGPADRVAVVLPNCPQFVVAFYATLRLRGVVVPLNPLSTETELHRQLSECSPAAVVCLDKNYPTVAAAAARAGGPRIVVASLVDYLPVLERTVLRLPLPTSRRRRAQLTATLPRDVGTVTMLDVMRASTRPAASGPRRSNEPVRDLSSELATLQYTGGTTGVSRGAMLTHRNLVANAYQVRMWYADAQPGREVLLGVLPLFHTYGLTLCLTTSTVLAATLVLSPRFDLDVVLHAIDEYKPTLFPAVPPIYQALVDSPKARRHDLTSIRACVSGAMRLPPETAEAFERVTGARVVEGYGMTETAPATHANPLAGPFADPARVASKRGSIGVPLPSTRCLVVDPDNPERVVPPGEPGELAVSGPQVFRGYWGDEDTAGLFTREGYLLTGDVATMDDDGFFTIVDRKKELIVAGGFNIFPSEVEAVLLTHPAVVEACVVGVPDRYRGETTKAFVVVRASGDSAEAVTADDLVAHCARELTAYKVPKQVEFREALPRSDVGKVLRRALRDEELARLEREARS